MNDYGVIQWNEETSVTGFVPKPHAQIVEDLEYRLRSTLGSDIDLSSSSPLKQFIDSIAFELYYTWQALENVYYSSYIDYASGINLDNIGSVFGLIRYKKSAASGLIRVYRAINPVTGKYITGPITIPQGTVFVGKTTGLQYVTLQEYTIPEYPLGLSKDISVTCNTVGTVGNALAEQVTDGYTSGAISRIYADASNPYISKISKVVQLDAFNGTAISDGVKIRLRVYRKPGVTGDIVITKNALKTSDTSATYEEIQSAIESRNASVIDSYDKSWCMYFRNDTATECWYDPVVDTKSSDKYLYYYPGQSIREMNRYLMFVPTAGTVIIPSGTDSVDVECRYVWKNLESMTVYSTILPTVEKRSKSDGGSVNTMVSKIAAVGRVVQIEDFTNGHSDETDVEFRSRIKTYQTDTTSTSVSIETHIKTLSFVRACKVVDVSETINGTTLHFAKAMVARSDYEDFLNASKPGADAALVEAVTARTQQLSSLIAAVKPVGLRVDISAVPTNAFKVVAVIEFQNISEGVVIASVIAAIKAYFDGLNIDDPVELGKIADAIYSTDGVTRIVQKFQVTNKLTNVTKEKLLDRFTVESGNQACIEDDDILITASYPVN